MRVTFVLRPKAAGEIASAFEWYDSRGSSLSSLFSDALDKSLAVISTFPCSAPAAAAVSDGNIIRRARLKKFPYSIFYIALQDPTNPKKVTVKLVAFRHDKQSDADWGERAE